MYANVHKSTIDNSQDMEATSVSADTWMNKEDMVQWNISQEYFSCICKQYTTMRKIDH